MSIFLNNNFSKNFYLLFVLIISLEISYNKKQSIVIPFKTNNLIENNYSTKKQIFESFENMNIYTLFEIGNPPKQIPIFYNFYNSYMSFDSCLKISSLPKSTYNPSNSKTFKNLENNLIEDELNINTENGNIFKNFKFLNENKNQNWENLIGNIGFQNFFREYINNNYINPNFLKQLKDLGLIDYISYNFNYTSDTEGFININIEPNEYAPKLYSDNNIYTTYIVGVQSKEINKLGEYLWSLDINLVYYKNYEYKTITINEIHYEFNEDQYSALLDPTYGVIKGPYAYKNLIDRDFFKEFIKKNICFKSKENKKIFYYCYSSNKKEIKEKFPTLYFYHQEFNYTFELKYEDLFFEKNDILYFLIGFDTGLFGDNKFSEISEWILGKPFLNKYQFSFDVEKKEISLYENLNGYKDYNSYHPSEKKNIEKDTYLDRLLPVKNMVLIALSIFIIFVGFFCILYCLRRDHSKFVKESKNDENEKGKEYIELKDS